MTDASWRSRRGTREGQALLRGRDAVTTGPLGGVAGTVGGLHHAGLSTASTGNVATPTEHEMPLEP